MLRHLLLVSIFALTSQAVHVRDIIDANVFESHLPSSLSPTRISELLEVHSALRSSSSERGTYHYCGSIGSIVDAKRSIASSFADTPSHRVKTAYVKRSRDLACLVIESSDSEMTRLSHVITSLKLQRVDVPDMFKIDPSVMSALTKSLHNDFLASSHVLSLEYASPVSSHDADVLIQDILDTSGTLTAGLQLSVQWSALSSRIHSTTPMSTSGCIAAINGLHRVHHSNSVVFTDLSALHLSCLVNLVERAAVQPSVQRVSLTHAPKAFNYQGVGMTQSGDIHHTPYREAGLLGENEICGVADTGVDDLSCFLVDETHMRTPRDAMVYDDMRKIIQYIPFADEMDDIGGHGTHVVGTIVGSMMHGGLEIAEGVAPSAKVSFFDIGEMHEEYLLVPDLEKYVLPMAYEAGARVHSNSWGTTSSQYDYFSAEVDTFTYDHPDMLVVFAVGNLGEYGPFISSPATSKNGLAVGASIVRDDIDDSILPNKTVASFSSNGPTFDGRIKPDVVAPGDFLVSSFGSDGHESCAALEKRGTSMAAPVVAGNALLVRQYFRDDVFWSSICDDTVPNCNTFSPSGFFVKAVLLHAGTPMSLYVNELTGERVVLGAPLKDGYQGHGQIQLNQVLPLPGGAGLDPRLNLIVFDRVNIMSNDVREWNITVHDNMPLKVTVCWYDPPSNAYAFNNLLLHDLDLRVVGPDGVIHWGNGMGQPDDTNPNEQVYIAEPNPTMAQEVTYTIQVASHYLTEADDQEFALIITTSGAMEKPEGQTNRRLDTRPATAPEDDYITDIVTLPFNDVYLGVEERCFDGEFSFDFFSMPMFSFGEHHSYEHHSHEFHSFMPHSFEHHSMDMKNADMLFDFEPALKTEAVSTDDPTESDMYFGSYDFSMEHDSHIVSYDFPSVDFDFSFEMPSFAFGSVPHLSFPDFSYGFEFSMPNSFDFSFPDKCSNVPNIEVVKKFPKKGMLQKVTLELDPNHFGSPGGYYFTVLIQDPEGHTLQIGGDNYFPAKDFFYQRRWPEHWVNHHTSESIRSTRDVSALQMMSEHEDKDWTVAVAFGVTHFPMHPIPFSGDIFLEFAMEQTPSPSTAPSSTPTAAPNITPRPTATPTTSVPTATPTSKPSSTPTLAPTFSPTSTRFPTRSPTRRPTFSPTKAPTLAKTKVTYNHDLTFGGMDPDTLRNDAKAQVAARKTYADTVDYVTYEDVSIESIDSARRLRAVIEEVRALAGGAKITFSVAVILEDAGFFADEITSFLNTVQEKVQQTVDSGTFTQTLASKFAEENVTSIDIENLTVTSEMDYNPQVEILATAAPTPSPTEVKDTSSADTSDTSVVIIGAVVGGVVFLFLLGGGAYLYSTKKKKTTVHVSERPSHPELQHSNSVVPYSP